MDEIQRINQLRKELHEHNYRYYVLNQPTIGDQDFDFLMHELQDLEAKHPEMADPHIYMGLVFIMFRGRVDSSILAL